MAHMSYRENSYAIRRGNNPISIFEPSSGGIGIKLKTIKLNCKEIKYIQSFL